MVETFLYKSLDVGEVYHHSVAVQFARLAINGDDPVVAMQVLTLALVRELKAMTRRDFKSLFNVIHNGVVFDYLYLLPQDYSDLR